MCCMYCLLSCISALLCQSTSHVGMNTYIPTFLSLPIQNGKMLFYLQLRNLLSSYVLWWDLKKWKITGSIKCKEQQCLQINSSDDEVLWIGLFVTLCFSHCSQEIRKRSNIACNHAFNMVFWTIYLSQNIPKY